MVCGRVLVGALLVIGFGPASQGLSQVAPPSCPAGVVAQPTFSASDLDEAGSSQLVATHTIQVTTDFGSTLVDEGSIGFSLPASAIAVPPHGDLSAGPGGVLFTARAAGPLVVTATWTQDDGGGGKCAGSAPTTLPLLAATPMPRLKDERAVEHLHPNLKFDLLWRYGTNLGPTADLDPVRSWRAESTARDCPARKCRSRPSRSRSALAIPGLVARNSATSVCPGGQLRRAATTLRFMSMATRTTSR